MSPACLLARRESVPCSSARTKRLVQRKAGGMSRVVSAQVRGEEREVD